jgi:hypothetical protein
MPTVKKKPRPNAETISHWGDLYLKGWSFVQIHTKFHQWSLPTIVNNVYKHLYFREVKKNEELKKRLVNLRHNTENTAKGFELALEHLREENKRWKAQSNQPLITADKFAGDLNAFANRIM